MTGDSQNLILIGILMGLMIGGDCFYEPRGWRPPGPSFTFNNYQSQSQSSRNGHDTPSSSYGLPSDAYPSSSITTITPPPLSVTDIEPATITPVTTTSSTTTLSPISSTSTTTTPRSREPTTPFNIEDDSQANPALAVANSFLFNKPVYIYTSGFPTGFAYQPTGYTFI